MSLRLVALIILMPVAAFPQRDRDTYNPSNQSFEVSGQVNATDLNIAVSDVSVRLERFAGGIIDQINTRLAGPISLYQSPAWLLQSDYHCNGIHASTHKADLTVLFKVYLVFGLVRNSNGNHMTDVIDVRVAGSALRAVRNKYNHRS